jgi:hypothetical protein
MKALRGFVEVREVERSPGTCLHFSILLLLCAVPERFELGLPTCAIFGNYAV